MTASPVQVFPVPPPLLALLFRGGLYHAGRALRAGASPTARCTPAPEPVRRAAWSALAWVWGHPLVCWPCGGRPATVSPAADWPACARFRVGPRRASSSCRRGAGMSGAAPRGVGVSPGSGSIVVVRFPAPVAGDQVTSSRRRVAARPSGTIRRAVASLIDERTGADMNSWKVRKYLQKLRIYCEKYPKLRR